jgi:hypothetical protein
MKDGAVADTELADLLKKLSNAKSSMGRYKRHLSLHPQMKGQLDPILRGYEKLVSDLESHYKQCVSRQARAWAASAGAGVGKASRAAEISGARNEKDTIC